MDNRQLTVVSTDGCSGHGSAQLQPQRPNRWDAAKEQRFLEMLAVTANVRASLREVGMTSTSLYHRRRTRPAFARAWNQALDEGYALVEAQALDRAINGVPSVIDPKRPELVVTRPASDRIILTLIAAHAKRVGATRAKRAAMPDDPDRVMRRLRDQLDKLAVSLGVEVLR